MDGPLHDKTALVTGASGGAGLLAARALAQTGADLYLTGINPTSLNLVAEDIRKDFGTNADVHTGNLANDTDAEAIAMACGDAEIFFNCTGNLPSGAIDDIGDAQWRKSWEAAIFAPLNLCREILGHMGDAGRGLVVLVIDSPATPDANDICATVAGGALKALVKALGRSTPQGVKMLGLMTNRQVDAKTFSMAVTRLACEPERFATGSLITVADVNA
jgi:NAD(P)-dependent dehydrogenase (short-subunit alcohol dehydrogenase family)